MTAVQEATRRLHVGWRDPDRNAYVPIARLTVTDGPGGREYEFTYLKRAEQSTSFRPLLSYPNLHERVRSRTLPPLFANRVMSPERPDRVAFLERLALPPDADEFAILGSGAPVGTGQTLEVFALPESRGDGRATCRFFARGLRYLPHAREAALALREGAALRLERHSANPANTFALSLMADGPVMVGYLPECLVEFAHQVMTLHGPDAARVSVVRVNGEDSSPTTLLLCQLDCPDDVDPAAGAEFDPIAPA